MNVFGKDVVPPQERNEEKQIKIHGEIGRDDLRKFLHPAMFDIEFGHSQMVGQRITTDRRDSAKHQDNHNEHQKRQPN